MTRTLTIAIGLLLVLVLVLFNTTYTVNFHELAVKTRFGQPAGVVRDPGLHLKAPFFIDQVTRLDTRLQFVESPLETVLTQGGEQVVLQAYLQGRIAAIRSWSYIAQRPDWVLAREEMAARARENHHPDPLIITRQLNGINHFSDRLRCKGVVLFRPVDADFSNSFIKRVPDLSVLFYFCPDIS
jgi:hypothetical protein